MCVRVCACVCVDFFSDGKLCCVGRDDEQPEGFSLEFNVGDTFGIGWEQDAGECGILLFQI